VGCEREESENKPAPVIGGVCQLSLVEHALCPLDRRRALRDGLHHETAFRYSDPTGKRRTATVRIDCAYGLSPFDEFYLWGLLALTMAQGEPSSELYATPHYCLRELGVIEAGSKGGRTYRLFREAIERLSGVRYRCDAFYDPVRQEHRRVSFGIFGYSLPTGLESSRAWRIAWDPQLFELARVTGGRKWFDLERYRRLDPATRRLWLLLSKVLWRRETSGRFVVRNLAVDTLGFAPSIPTRQLRAKIGRCAEVLVDEQLLSPIGGQACRFTNPRGNCFVQFQRGPEMHVSPGLREVTSPLLDPLQAVGLDEPSIRYVLRSFSHAAIQRWVDVTLLAKETKSPDFFKRSAAAFLIDNLKADAQNARTPPDWYVEARKREKSGPVTRPRTRASLSRIADPSESPEAFLRGVLPTPKTFLK